MSLIESELRAEVEMKDCKIDKLEKKLEKIREIIDEEE